MGGYHNAVEATSRGCDELEVHHSGLSCFQEFPDSGTLSSLSENRPAVARSWRVLFGADAQRCGATTGRWVPVKSRPTWARSLMSWIICIHCH